MRYFKSITEVVFKNKAVAPNVVLKESELKDKVLMKIAKFVEVKSDGSEIDADKVKLQTYTVQAGKRFVLPAKRKTEMEVNND